MTEPVEIVDTRVRIPRDLYERIKRLAQIERRSINAQMLTLLSDATKRAEKQHEEDEAGHDQAVQDVAA